MDKRRKRILDAIDHVEPDRVPVDFGSTAVTGIHVLVIEKLRSFLGLEKRLVKMFDPYQGLGILDEDLKERLGVDVDGAMGPRNKFGVVNEDWIPWTTPWGQEVLVPRRFRTTIDADGSVLAYPQGDTSAPASGKMPAGSWYFDAIIRQEELPDDDEMLNADDNIEEFGPLSSLDLSRIKENVEKASSTGRAVIGSFGGTGLGGVGDIPGMGLKHPKGIRDISEWYMSIALRPDHIRKIFEKQIEIGIDNLRRINEACGDKIDIVFTCGSDFGTQNGTFYSVEAFQKLFEPYYKIVNGWIHANTKWKIFKHSCGSVVDLIPDFIECGFDILNPVQSSARGMDPGVLKKRFGKDIAFWGGGVDTQRTLPFGTPSEIRREVLNRCEVLSKGGGFVFNSIHNIQPGVPMENLVAMIEAYNEFNGGSL